MAARGRTLGDLFSIAERRLDRRALVRGGTAAGALLGGAALGWGGARAQTPTAGECSGEEATLTYGFWNAEQRPAIEAQIEAFREQHPNIKVEPQVVPFADYWTKLQTGIGGGETYDVFWMNGPNLPVYASQGALMDIESAIGEGGIDASAYPQSLLDLYTYEGPRYGIPRDFDTIGLYYHKDLFDAAGVAYPTAEWTWDDLRAAAEQLTKRDGDVTTQWGFGVTLSDQQTLFNFIHQAGGQVLNEDGTRALVDEPAACEAILFLTELVRAGISPGVAEQQANNPYQTLFPAGRIAMITGGSWHAGRLSEANPAIAVAPLPRRKQRATIIHGLANAVWAKTPRPCEALAFVTFLASREAEEILAETATVIPAMNGLQETWKAAVPELDLQVFLDAVEYAVPFPTSPAGTEWNAKLDEVLLQAWSGDLEGEEICRRAAEAANSALPGGEG